MYIPDPIELMQMRVDDLAFKWEKSQRDVPIGHFRCPYCGGIFDYEPIQLDPSPDSASCCYTCLDEDSQKASDEVFGK